jgi:catechol 2,3-dioxygenase-like lactoylglutathione lyase family enzyme
MPEDAAAPEKFFNNFVQIGAVVADLDQSIKGLTEIFGIGPFRVIDWPPAGRKDIQRFYYGQPASFTARMAFTELGPVELELIQPLEGESIWADFLAVHGPGIHHIRFNVLDLDPVVEYLGERGIGIAQMGSGIRPGTVWANFDTESHVGFTIEVMKMLAGTSGRTPMIGEVSHFGEAHFGEAHFADGKVPG